MKTALIFGAGNIGRGFIGELLNKSGYRIEFIDVDNEIVDSINNDGKYSVFIVGDSPKELVVDNIHATNGNETDKVIDLVTNADLITTSVGVGALKFIAPVIAKGLKNRLSKSKKELNIIICENMLDSDKYLKELISKHLDDNFIPLLDKYVGFVKASIGRMVPPIDDPKMGKLDIIVEEYNHLPVDGSQIKGQLKIHNLIPHTPFNYYIQQKIFIHNMSHATLAYLGWIYRYKYTADAMKNSLVKYVVSNVLKEINIAFFNHYNVDVNMLFSYSDDLMYRYKNKALKDTVYRVGNDPIRKLGQNDRLIGAYKFCIENDTDPIFIRLAIALGYYYRNKDDEKAIKIGDLIEKDGIKSTLKEISNIEDQTILKVYDLLSDRLGIENAISHLEKLRHEKSKITSK